jgi:hypothetical protein
MADRLYLSIWLSGFSPLNMHQAFGAALRQFPFSSQAPQLYLRVGAVDSAEPALQEQVFDRGEGLVPVLDAMERWKATDVSFEVEGFWDLWQERPEGWRLWPTRVNLLFHGPSFPSEWGEQVRMDLGVEEMYLPDFALAGRELGMMQSNVRSLLRLTKDVESALAAKPMSVKQMKLWSEGGGNFAEKLRRSLETPTQQ